MTCFRYSNNDVFVWIPKASANMVTARSAIKNSHIEDALILIFQNGSLNDTYSQVITVRLTNRLLKSPLLPQDDSDADEGASSKSKRKALREQEAGTPHPSFVYPPSFHPSAHSSFLRLRFSICLPSSSVLPSFLPSFFPCSLLLSQESSVLHEGAVEEAGEGGG